MPDPHATTDLQGKQALVTGASAGIGEATAEALAREGADVVLVARRRERLEELAKRLEADHGVEAKPVVLDVRDRDAVEEQVGDDAQIAEGTDILVNNAGLARGKRPVHEADPDDWEEMVDTNVKGLLYVTRQVLPHMVDRGAGHLVNLGSTAGRWVYPGGQVYCGTKHAVRAISEGTRMDIHGSGVRVTNIEPGLVETEFSEVRFHGDEDRAEQVYADTRPLVAEDIAETIVWCVQRPAHVNVQELVIFPTDQGAMQMVDRSRGR